MRVSLVSYYYKPHIGGVENSLYYLAKEALAAGHTVQIVASDADLTKKRRLPNLEVVDGIEVRRFKRFLPWLTIFKLASPLVDVMTGFFFFRRLRKTFNPDIVFARHYIPGYAAKLAGLRVYYLIPGIVRFQEELSLLSSQKRSLKGYLINCYIRTFIIPIAQGIQNRLLDKADRLFVFSNVMREQTNAVLKRRRDIAITKPGVEIKRFSKYTRTQARNLLGLKEDAFIFLMLGRLTVHKNIPFVLEAFAHAKLPSNCLLIIAGDGPEREKLEHQRNTLRIHDRVFLYPATNEPEKFFVASDAFIMASVHETFGQTVIEAMAAGNKLIGVTSNSLKNATATQEVLNEPQDSLVAPEELGNCMTIVASETISEVDKMRNIKRAAALYSWNSLLQQLLVV